MRTAKLMLGGLFGLATACNSLDPKAEQEGVRLVIPTDARPVQSAQSALHAPPPISGGTLAVTPGGRFAVAADPDRDRVSIVDLQDGTVRDVALDAGAEPGRVVTDTTGRAYVALRGSGQVISIQLGQAQVERSAAACSAPRGLALEPAAGLLHLACADGRLVTFSAPQSAADASVLSGLSELPQLPLERVRELKLDSDLRDVIVQGDRLLVSTFKDAQLFEVDAAGAAAANRNQVDDFSIQVFRTREIESAEGSIVSSEVVEQPMSARLAWRTAVSDSGQIVMLHQGASTGVVDIDAQSDSPSQSAYGGGGGSSCGAIVGPALSILSDDFRATAPLVSGVMSVDLALNPATGRLAIVQAGGADPAAPRPTTLFEGDGNFASPVASDALVGSSPFGSPLGNLLTMQQLPPELTPEQAGTSLLTVMDTGSIPVGQGVASCISGNQMQVLGQATSVVWTPTGDLIVQSREPALLMLLPAVSDPGATARVFPLGGSSVRDTGHEIFHRDAGGGIACASCHAEGGEDGHTWSFTSIGSRRTQPLYIGLEGTEPFHWNGDESDLDEIMVDVFVGRMGGVHQSAERLDQLSGWLFGLRPPAPIEVAEAPAAVRGKALFESSAGCTTCHSGKAFTNNKSFDVGTGAKLQVPSLRGVGYRAPLMHNGCAARLEDRFDPSCGGSQHGNVAQLQAAEIGDLVAYLRTL